MRRGEKLRPWTGAEHQRFLALWKEGRETSEIAEALGRSISAIKNRALANRNETPRRHAPKGRGKGHNFQIWLSHFLVVRLRQELRWTGLSTALYFRALVRCALLDDAFLARVRKLVQDEATRN